MGFMDKARAAASDLAAKADTALASSGIGGPGGGEADKYFRDLGVLAYLSENGRPASAEDHERVMSALREMEARGAIRSFAMQTSAAAGAVPPPPPPGGATPPPPPGTVPPPTAQTEAPMQEQHPATAPPPPPPSWAKNDDTQS